MLMLAVHLLLIIGALLLVYFAHKGTALDYALVLLYFAVVGGFIVGVPLEVLLDGGS
jgi:hypothetical protein